MGGGAARALGAAAASLSTIGSAGVATLIRMPPARFVSSAWATASAIPMSSAENCTAVRALPGPASGARLVEQVGHESQRPFFRITRIDAHRFGPQRVES